MVTATGRMIHFFSICDIDELWISAIEICTGFFIQDYRGLVSFVWEILVYVFRELVVFPVTVTWNLKHLKGNIWDKVASVKTNRGQ